MKQLLTRTRVTRTWELLRTRRVRRVANAIVLATSLAIAALAARWFASTGFPLAHANAGLLGGAAACFLGAAGVKAWGWSCLFGDAERPRTTTLAAAGGFAALAGVALPGRVDDAVRVAFVRRFAGSRVTVTAIALSLFTLGLVDTIAMTPLASTAAASASSAALRAGLCFVAAMGVGAAGFLLALPYVASRPRLVRFRLSRWLHDQWPSGRQAGLAIGWVLASWLARGAGIFLLLSALGLGGSFELAMVFMCADAAAASLPVGPAGAVAQAGAGAAVLLSAGIPASGAIHVAVATQLVTAFAAACVILVAGAAGLACRYVRFLPAQRTATAAS